MKMNKLIACDIDGVLAQLHVAWYTKYNRDYNDNLQPEDVTAWNLHEFVKPECGLKIYDYLKDPSIYDDVPPYEDALEAILYLKSQGYRVIYPTSSPTESSGRKFKWLRQYGFIESQRDYVEVQDKSLIRADVLIDDYQVNLDTFVGKKILKARTWNVKYKYNIDYLFAENWEDVKRYCDE
jgi:5'-nucleotidase